MELGAFERSLPAGECLAIDERDPDLVQLTMPLALKLRGGRSWLTAPNGRALVDQRVDPVLARALQRAHQTLAKLNARPWASIDVLRTAKTTTGSYEQRLLPIGFLAPEIQMAILDGTQPAGLKLEQLLRDGVPLAWADQRRLLGF